MTIDYSQLSAALDVKPFSGEGTSSVEPLFAEVGRVCNLFELLEDEVVRLFQFLCGGPNDATLNMSRIISAASSFNTKIDLTKEAAKTFLAQDSVKRDAVLAWLKLCVRAAGIRNKIVHGHATRVAYMRDGSPAEAAFLLPSFYDWGKDAVSGKVADAAYCWNAEQLQQYAAALLSLKAMMMTVREELAGTADEPHPEVLDPTTLLRK